MNMSRNIGYVRVSHRDQNEARQIIALKKEGIPDTDIYTDKLSGKDFNRPQYQKMLKEVKEGDCIFILSIDRLGRNYEEMIEQWNHITKELKVDITVLDMPLLDTRKEKNLIGAFISDIVLYILSFVAENERANIKERQAAGIAAAKAREVKFGRKGKTFTDEFMDAYVRWKNKLITSDEAARECGMGRSTFYRMVKKMG